jgi:hypothetical protein
MKKAEMANCINEKHSNMLFNLYGRWQDEKEYEDFDDYVSAFKKYVPSVVKGLKKPFGFVIKCDDGELFAYVKVQGRFLGLFFRNY